MSAIKLNNDQKINQIEISHEKDKKNRTLLKRRNSYVTKTKPLEYSKKKSVVQNL